MLGGLWRKHRKLIDDYSIHGRFEKDVNELLGTRICLSIADAEDFWCALANNGWYHPDFPNQECSYSFRAAGDLIAAIKQEGDYMDWYCCRFDYAVVSEWILEAMATRNWTPEHTNGDGYEDGR